MDAPARVAVPLDGSAFARRALVPARVLAAGLGVAVELLAVRYGERPDEVEDELRACAREAGIETPEIVAVCDHDGSPPVLLADMLRPESLLCMTTHARQGVGRAVLGSVAEELVRTLHRPIVLVGPSVDVAAIEPVDEVIVPIDGTSASQEVLPEATPLAHRLGAKVRLVQVVHPDPTARARLLEDGAILDDAAFEALVRSVTAVPVHGEVVPSPDPAVALAELATPGSLVALVTHARRGLARAVLGSTTAAVVHRVHVPMLTFRPIALPDV
jgi:nucleotide-binding universal stress UspA family protein